MNLFFYLQTFILNYSFIVILSDHFFALCFIKTQPFVKRKPAKTEKRYRNDRVPFQAGFTVSDFMKIPPVGAELFHADGRTDMTKLIVSFRNFAKASKIGKICHIIWTPLSKTT